MPLAIETQSVWAIRAEHVLGDPAWFFHAHGGHLSLQDAISPVGVDYDGCIDVFTRHGPQRLHSVHG